MTRILVVAPTSRELAGASCATSVVGIGQVSEDATRAAIAAHKPDLLLSIGFNGALDGNLRTGDLVISEGVTLTSTGERIAISEGHSHAAGLALHQGGIDAHRGDTATTNLPLATMAQKLSYRTTTRASVVDMETFWIAKAAAEAGVPTLSVRTVIDEAQDAIPKFAVDIIADGGRNEIRHALKALVNPLNISAMIKMARQARRATTSTKAMLDVLVPALSEAPAVAETGR